MTREGFTLDSQLIAYEWQIVRLWKERERLRAALSAIEVSISVLLAAKVHDERYHALVQAELAQIKREVEKALKGE